MKRRSSLRSFTNRLETWEVVFLFCPPRNKLKGVWCCGKRRLYERVDPCGIAGPSVWDFRTFLFLKAETLFPQEDSLFLSLCFHMQKKVLRAFSVPSTVISSSVKSKYTLISVVLPYKRISKLSVLIVQAALLRHGEFSFPEKKKKLKCLFRSRPSRVRFSVFIFLNALRTSPWTSRTCRAIRPPFCDPPPSTAQTGFFYLFFFLLQNSSFLAYMNERIYAHLQYICCVCYRRCVEWERERERMNYKMVLLDLIFLGGWRSQFKCDWSCGLISHIRLILILDICRSVLQVVLFVFLLLLLFLPV